jgi:hypothetical protein
MENQKTEGMREFLQLIHQITSRTRNTQPTSMVQT